MAGTDECTWKSNGGWDSGSSGDVSWNGKSAERRGDGGASVERRGNFDECWVRLWYHTVRKWVGFYVCLMRATHGLLDSLSFLVFFLVFFGIALGDISVY